MKFEPGKYYKHSTGDMIATLDFLETTLHGRALIAERMFAGHYDLYAIGTSGEGYAPNWRESTKEEWMKNFSKD